MDVRRVRPSDTHPLRQRILRPHQTIEQVAYPGDELDGAAHFGVFLDDTMVAAGTIHPEGEPGEWRLRGMATVPEHRGRGFGSALVEACLQHARANGGTRVWCNARLKAADFYRRLGFEARGAPFELPEIGLHYLMQCYLAQERST